MPSPMPCREPRSTCATVVAVYRRDDGPQTYEGPLETEVASAAVALSPTLALPFEVFS